MRAISTNFSWKLDGKRLYGGRLQVAPELGGAEGANRKNQQADFTPHRSTDLNCSRKDRRTGSNGAVGVLLVADFKNFTQYQELAASNGSLKQSLGASAPGLLFMRGNRAKEKSRPGAWPGQWGRLGIFSEHPKSTSMVKTQ